MNNFEKIFESLARVNDRSVIWNQFLDYCIYINLLKIDDKPLDFKGNESQYANMLREWLSMLSDDLEYKPYSDRLGMFYEELVISHSKSKSMGQFYTPEEVTHLMTELSLTVNDNFKGAVNDCACGSARLLLSAHVKSKGGLICIGQDLDEVSCKMAVLNFWSHGVRGSILHMDTLTGDFYNAWRVNNYLYQGLPIPHIELVNQWEAYNFLGMKRDSEVVELNKPVVEVHSPAETVQTKLM